MPHTQAISDKSVARSGLTLDCWLDIAVAEGWMDERDLRAAITAAENMLQNWGQRSIVEHTMLSDDEFEEIQRRHFGKRKDPAGRARAEQSLNNSPEAISAFRLITGLTPMTTATPDDCERFQNDALNKPRNWRKRYPNSRMDDVPPITPNTVVKWSRALQAAFERANRNAGRKCVRGVVAESKLLASNPWKQCTWIEGTEPKKRRFSDDELLLLLDYFESKWPELTVATLFAKVSLWGWARRSEVADLRWQCLRIVNGEYHFDFVGKWGGRKWARIPARLYGQLSEVKSDSPYVFAAYNEQLRRHYAHSRTRFMVKKIGSQYEPRAFADWFHDKLVECVGVGS